MSTAGKRGRGERKADKKEEKSLPLGFSRVSIHDQSHVAHLSDLTEEIHDLIFRSTERKILREHCP
jgi:hypothetical protein